MYIYAVAGEKLGAQHGGRGDVRRDAVLPRATVVIDWVLQDPAPHRGVDIGAGIFANISGCIRSRTRTRRKAH